MKGIVLVVTASLIGCASVYAWEAAPPQTFEEKVTSAKAELLVTSSEKALKIVKEETSDPKPLAQAAARYTELLAAGSGDPGRTNKLLAQEVGRYYIEKALARSAPQVTQVNGETAVKLQLLQVQQNQRIIELLERLVRKPAK